MLTSVRIRNFKKLKDAEFELGKSVVFIGPNNSGKTTALQALALWDVGCKLWSAKRGGKSSPEKRPGVTINRRDLISIPVPVANLLWRDLHVRRKKSGANGTQNVLIEIVVEGVTDGRAWSCGFEFDYANDESFYCRPLRAEGEGKQKRIPVPEETSSVRVAFLPPMSGLSAVEPKLEIGRINVLIGEGQTAQVLRNLCHQIHDRPSENKEWDNLVNQIKSLFGVDLLPPEYIAERGEIAMSYMENDVKLDLSSSGRGIQQVLLLLTHLYANPGSVLLLDEPDAHLEVLRQRQIYKLITDVAAMQGSQIIAASHSEIVLDEAADKDIVIAFVGRPHRIDDRGSQLLKALKEIGYDQYAQAEQVGWVLYLEGPTDLAILQAFAKTIDHPSGGFLERPFVHYVGNHPNEARRHYYGLREAYPSLLGVALFDRIDAELKGGSEIRELMWKRREIESYFCCEDVLLTFARGGQPDDLFGLTEANRRETAMRESISEMTEALRKLRKDSPWSHDLKVTDDFFDPLFENYFEKLSLSPDMMRKTNYHILAGLLPKSGIDSEVVEKLDSIVEVAKRAKPRGE